MNTPYRLCRAVAQDTAPESFTLTDRQRDRREMILKCATAILANFGTATINFTNLSVGLRLTRAALRFHFADMHTLLVEILQRHLMNISHAIGEIPHNDPNLHQRRRAAYFAATRTPTGAFNQAHLLLIRDSYLLPPDLRSIIDLTHHNLAPLLGGKKPAVTLALLDSPALDATDIEEALTPTTTPQTTRPSLTFTPAAAAPTPAPPTWTPSYPTLFCGPADDPTAPISHAPLIPPEPAAPERRHR